MSQSTEQRINMVESQVRPSDVTDRRIIRAMLEVPRELFVPASLRALAYMDEAVPVTEDGGQARRFLLAPRTFAKLVQLADVEHDATVLDVGCATGYSTAILARLAKAVVALDVDAALAASATQTLRAMGVGNVVVLEGALEKGAPSRGPYDAILLNGSVPELPEELGGQLKDGGRLVAVVEDGALGRAVVWTRTGKVADSRPAFDASAQPLPGFSRKAEFVL